MGPLARNDRACGVAHTASRRIEGSLRKPRGSLSVSRRDLKRSFIGLLGCEANDESSGAGTMAHIGKRAVVIGASMGGLLAARALADHYDEVTIIERDALPEDDEPRKGVPQGRHTHGLLARGREVLEQLFPNFTGEMVAKGALSGDTVDAILWFNHGVYLCNTPSKLVGLAISRPMLENNVRRRLLQHANVRLHERCDVLEPVGAQRRVTGVRVQSRVGSKVAQTINADLVIDASGRGSRSPAWLSALGYQAPREEQIKINVGYTTRQYRRLPPAWQTWSYYCGLPARLALRSHSFPRG